MKTQIIIIHGGHALDIHEDFLKRLREKKVTLENFKLKRDWKDSLQKKLGENFEVLNPVMPNKENAKYQEWKIWFERLTPFVKNNPIFIGHSLGGLFLIKYFSENTVASKIKSLMLVAASFHGKDKKHTRNNNFAFSVDLKNVSKQVEKIIFYHSKDDQIVPLTDFEAYKESLPTADFKAFTTYGHFNDKNFPELVRDIKKLTK